MAENTIRSNKENDAAAVIARFLGDENRVIRFRVFPRMLSEGNWDISVLELSQRSYNCLKRSGIGTVGVLAERIEGIGDLLRIRNLGVKSAKEIMFRLYLFQYQVLSEEKKREYLKEVISLNRLAGQAEEQDRGK